MAGLTDGIDGLLARKLNQKSALGAYLDPIADKLLLSSSFVILAMAKKVAWWLTLNFLSGHRRVETALLLLLVLDEPLDAVERHAAVVTNDPSSSVCIR